MFAVAARSKYDIAVGNSALGGTIFYVDGTGRHGLVVGPYDLGKWGTTSTSIEGYPLAPTSTLVGTGVAPYTGIYNGQKATQLYLDAGGSSQTWGLKLAGYNASGSYSDWYIPNKDELVKLMEDYFYTLGGTIPNMYDPPGYDGAPYGTIQESLVNPSYPPATHRYYFFADASVPYVAGTSAKIVGWPMRPIRRF